MDPLSVSASIVSLIGAADTVVRRLYQYIKAAKGADKDIATLSMEITDLYGVLSSLHLVASRFESEVSELSMQERSMQIDHIHACYNTLDSIRSLLSKDDPSTTNSKMESVRRRLHWPLSESKTKALIDEVGKHKQTLALALNADTLVAMLQSLSRQKEMSNGIDEIRNRLIASSMTETRRKILRSFSQGTDPQRYLSAALRVRQMGTGLWICEDKQFQAWMSSDSSSKLFITGIPGAGKTVLTATIIEEITKRVGQGEKGSAVAYYFCDYKDPATQNPRSILASLTGQLAAQDEQCYAIAQAFHQDHYPSEGPAMTPEDEEFKKCLLDMIRTLDHAYIIAADFEAPFSVDALDECSNDRVTVLELLHSLNDFPNDCIKTLFTGREEIDIQRALDDYDKLSIAANSHDIRLYVDSEIARRTKNRTLRIRDPALQEEIRERLVNKAEGMFRWVTCQIDHICALSNDRSRRKALDTLPPDLPTTYERVLERVNASDEENQIIVQRTLRWILNSRNILEEAITKHVEYPQWASRPLSLPELSEAVSVSIRDRTLERDAIVDPEAILHWCGSLVRRTPGADTLELAHYSVKEYLEHIDTKAFPQYIAYKADLSRDSLDLAKTCLTYLCFDVFDIAQIHDLQRLRSFMKDYKFLRYCVQAWDEHAQVVEDDESLLELLQEFLNIDRTNQYLAWMSWTASIRAEVLDIGKPDAVKREVDYTRMGLLLSSMADSSPLHWASCLALPTMASLLIAKGCNVNQASTFFGRPLLAAVAGTDTIVGPYTYTVKPWILELGRRCQYQTVKVLLEAGADCNIKIRYHPDGEALNVVKSSALSEALADRPNWDIVRLLLDSGSLCDRDSLDILSKKEGGGFEIFQKLTEHNIEESQINHFRKLAIDANLGWDSIFDDTTIKAPQRVLSGIEITPLFFNAAGFGRLQVMEKLAPIVAQANDGMGINQVDKANSTALHVACQNNHPEIVKLLIRQGIDIDKVDASGLTALMIASEEMSTDCGKILLQHGADVRVATKDGITALHQAAAHSTSMMLETILESAIPEGPSLYTRTKEGHTLLHAAASSGSLPTIKYILEQFEDATPQDRSQSESTCLHQAAWSGSLPAVKFFLDKGLSPNDRNSQGKTPVHCAIEAFKESSELVKLLHARGADLNAAHDETGDTPLFHQIRYLGPGGNGNMMNCFNYLLDRTTDINYCDKAGNNALHLLAAVLPDIYPNVYLEFVYLALIKCGCSMTKCNVEGHSPFQRFIMNWSEVELDASGFFKSFYQRSDDGGDAAQGFPEFEGIRVQVGMTMFILAHTKRDAETLGPPDTVRCSGASLLSLAVRTTNERFVEQVLEYDNDVDRRDMLPGFGNHPLNTPVEWMCSGFIPNKTLMRNILSSSKDLEKQRPDGLTPAHIAASAGDVEVLEELLTMGIKADCLSSDGRTPLMCACFQRRFEVIRLLYERGARCAVTEGYDTLKAACGAGDDDVLATLFAMPGLNINWQKTFNVSLNLGPKAIVIEDMDYFHYAAFHGRASVLSWLFGAGLVHDVNGIVGDGGLTALYFTSGDLASHLDTLPLLLSKGADVHFRCTERRWTALHVAAEAGNINAIEILLAHGADASAMDTRKFTPQLVALDANQIQAAQRLLEHTAVKQDEVQSLQPNDNKVSPHETTLDMPLHSCAKTGQVDMIRKLLDDGADINARARNCTTPVMKAARGGHLEALDLLKERGADFVAKDLYGWSALHHACLKRRSLVIPGLLELGLSFTDSDLDDSTPLHFCSDDEGLQDVVKARASPAELQISQLASLIERAIYSESSNMLTWLLAQLDNTQKRDALRNDGVRYYALHTAASQGGVEQLNILLNAGAEIDRWSEKWSFPLACAATMGRADAVQLLAKKGAQLKHVLPDGTEQCAIEAAKNYPKIQLWLRDFYQVSADQTG